MDWLCQEFGDAILRDAEIVLLDDRQFQLLNSGSRTHDGHSLQLEQQVQANEWFNRIAKIVELDSNRVQLAFEGEVEYVGKDAQKYQKRGAKFEIGLAKPELRDRESLIALLAHEATYIRLVREERLEESAKDADQVCDLATVFWGLGLFSANASVREGEDPAEPGVGYQSFLSPAVFGYALALFCYLRGETKPVWATDLRGDVRQAFLDSQAYLDTYGTSDAREYDSATQIPVHSSTSDRRDPRSSQPSQDRHNPSLRSEPIGFSSASEFESDDPDSELNESLDMQSHTAKDQGSRPTSRGDRPGHYRFATTESTEDYEAVESDEYRKVTRVSRSSDKAGIAADSAEVEHNARHAGTHRERKSESEFDPYLAPLPRSDDAATLNRDREGQDERNTSEHAADISHNPIHYGPGECVACGDATPRGHRLCHRCEGTADGKRAALRAELAQHDDKIWGVHFMFLVAVITLILIVVAAVNTSY